MEMERQTMLVVTAPVDGVGGDGGGSGGQRLLVMATPLAWQET
jgi:hypothetical protein